MAQRRMFSLDIVDTDRFLDMPLSAQALYFHLGMRADDDGFVGSPRKITTLVGAAPDDLKILIGKGFVIPFESGVCVITDWKLNNYLRSDRYKPTIYRNEIKMLSVDANGSYIFGIPNVNQPAYQMDTQVRLDQYSVDQYSTVQQQTAHTDVVVSEPSKKAYRKINAAPDVSCLSFIIELSDRDKLKILKATGNDVPNIERAYALAKSQGGINNLIGFIIGMAGAYQRGEVSPPVKVASSVKRNRFVNFDQRNIDFKALERLELEQLKESMKDGKGQDELDDLFQ